MPRAWREGNARFRRMHCLPSKALLFLSRRKRKNRSHAGIDWTPSDDYELAEEIFASNTETTSNSRWMLKRRPTYLIGGRNPRRDCVVLRNRLVFLRADRNQHPVRLLRPDVAAYVERLVGRSGFLLV